MNDDESNPIKDAADIIDEGLSYIHGALVGTGETIDGAIRSCFISPNEVDSNCEPANVVDGLFAIARALTHLAKALEK